MQKFNTLLAFLATMLMMFAAQAQTAVYNVPEVPASQKNFTLDYVTTTGRAVPQGPVARPEGSTQVRLDYGTTSGDTSRFFWQSNLRFGVNDTFMIDLWGVIFDSLIDDSGITYNTDNYYSNIDTVRFPMRLRKTSPVATTDTIAVEILDPVTGDVIWDEIFEETTSVTSAQGGFIFREVYPDLLVCGNQFAVRVYLLGPTSDTLDFLSSYLPGACPRNAQGQLDCGVNESAVPNNSFFGLHLQGTRFGSGLYLDCNSNMMPDQCEQYFLQNNWIETIVTLIDKPLQYTTNSTPDDGTGTGTAEAIVIDNIPVTYSWFSLDGNNSNLPNTALLTGLNADRIILGIAPDGYNCGGEGVLDTVEVASNVSIEDFNNAGINSINAYPNPTSGSLTLDMELDGREDVRIQVLSVTGKVLFETSSSQVERINQPIDLGDVAPGVYMLNVTTSRGSAAQRILVN